jgi:hypothetical protein
LLPAGRPGNRDLRWSYPAASEDGIPEVMFAGEILGGLGIAANFVGFLLIFTLIVF